MELAELTSFTEIKGMYLWKMIGSERNARLDGTVFNSERSRGRAGGGVAILVEAAVEKKQA